MDDVVDGDGVTDRVLVDVTEAVCVGVNVGVGVRVGVVVAEGVRVAVVVYDAEGVDDVLGVALIA